MKIRFLENSGATLVETIIVVSIVAVVVSSLIAGSTSSLRSTSFTSTKAQATKYAQEGIELARRQRDLSWSEFFNRRDQTWCINKDGNWTSLPTCPVNIDNFFTRTVILGWNAGANRMEIVSVVSWPSGGRIHSSEIRTHLTQWR